MPNSKQIVYLSQAQYAELITNGTITVDGVTVTYDENDIYVTPQAEPVTDVRVNGTSVTANGVANIPTANGNTFGVIRPHDNAFEYYQGSLRTKAASLSDIKEGNNTWKVITPSGENATTFYGLAKASGDTTQSQSSNSVGTYTPEAKGAIQEMLGVSDLIATAENSLVASKAYAIGDVFTANGKLYKATAAIAANDTIVLQNEGETVSGTNAIETKVGDGFPHDVQVNGVSVVSNGVANVPMASHTVPGVVIVRAYNDGLLVNSSGQLVIVWATEEQVKLGAQANRPITPINQHISTFYGLAKAAGDATQAASNNAVGTYTDDAKAAIKNMIGVNVDDVQIEGTSIVSNGIASLLKANATTYGLVKVQTGNTGVYAANDGTLYLSTATDTQIKNGSGTYPRAITPGVQNKAVFYGLAQAAGDTTMASSTNAVGTYTDNAKASIKAMFGIQDGSTGTVDVSGTTPTITAVENTRYVCGEVTSLDFTPAASGICIVRFTSGSTITVLTMPSTVKFPEWFDPTSLETNTIYEICVTDGVYGAVMSWAQ